MTERDRVLEVMSLLSRSGLDHSTILEECKPQSEMDDRGNIWEVSLNEKLKALELHYDVSVPIRKEIGQVAEEKILKLRGKNFP